MSFLAAILVLALSRAEILERFRAAPVTKVNGLVQVAADCPPDVRKEFQMPIAGFAADICRKLNHAARRKEEKRANPGIVIYLGDVRTNVTDVVTRVKRHDGGETYTRIYLPAPGFADVARLRTEVVKGYFRAVTGEELDDAAAEQALRKADPRLKVSDEYARLAKWFAGEPVTEDDEYFLRLSRAVLMPGAAFPEDVLRFASRLYFYSNDYAVPLCGKYHECSFREALALVRFDPRIRLLAYVKAPQIVAYGGGRGESLSAAATAYSEFLYELAALQKSTEELSALLEAAEIKLNVAMEEARHRAEGTIQ